MKRWLIDSAIPLTVGLLVGILGGFIVDHAMIQNMSLLDGKHFDLQTWLSAALGTVAGALISWLMSWVYAKKAERDARALAARLPPTAEAAALGAVINLAGNIIADHPAVAMKALINAMTIVKHLTAGAAVSPVADATRGSP